MKKILSILLAVLLLTGVCAQGEAALSQEELWTLVKRAYIFSFPLVLMDATMTVSTNTEAPTAGKAPVNQMSHARSLATAQFHQVVTPNVDTLYSQMFFDLSQDAVVFHKPAADRFMCFQIMDAWSDTVAVLGTGADTQDERTYLLTGPDYAGEVPEGMVRVEIPTAIGWMLGRTVCYGPEDLENIYALQDQIDACALTLWRSGAEQPQGVYAPEKDGVPIRMALGMGPQQFFDRVNELLAQNPAYAADAEAMAAFSALGVGPGLRFDASILGADAVENWKAMLGGLTQSLVAATGQFMVRNGAFRFYGEPISRFGQEYDYRALVAIAGFGANPVDVAMYLKADLDDAGEALNGENNYILHFEPDALPPVKENGFWSITAYGEDDFLIDNPLNRYAIGDRAAYEWNADGSLDIYLQAEAPVGHETNWLPVCGEGFHLYLRVYLPEEDVLSGVWRAPSLTKQ